jgi:hypothetical protein
MRVQRAISFLNCWILAVGREISFAGNERATDTSAIVPGSTMELHANTLRM